jgi:phage FluMu protein Com
MSDRICPVCGTLLKYIAGTLRLKCPRCKYFCRWYFRNKIACDIYEFREINSIKIEVEKGDKE